VNAAAFEFIRRAIPMAAKELAGLLGVAPETVSRREHDRSGLDRATWVTLGGLLADVIEVTHTTRDRRKENARQPQRWSTAYKLIW
jgi:transcriptional regulator with XRE-family HTH domain